LNEALRAIDDSTIVINFTGEVKPAVIKGEGSPETTQLLLPVRVF
jgi:DNA polymerase III sliding clamp (beta) subunit (PCNA family)